MKNTALILAAMLSITALPSFAQGGPGSYHRSYGNSRVTQQNQTGLYTPSATYIGAGTLSRSAQGKSAGVGSALPVVNMGSHVRTAGDNMYNDQGSMRASNGAFLYQDQYMAQQAAAQRKAMQQQQRIQQQQMRNYKPPQGNYYVPGQNGAATVQSGGQTYYNPGGTATYAESSSRGNGGRQF